MPIDVHPYLVYIVEVPTPYKRRGAPSRGAPSEAGPFGPFLVARPDEPPEEANGRLDVLRPGPLAEKVLHLAIGPLVDGTRTVRVLAHDLKGAVSSLPAVRVLPVEVVHDGDVLARLRVLLCEGRGPVAEKRREERPAIVRPALVVPL